MEIDVGFVPYDNFAELNLESEGKHEYAEFLGDADARLYWEMQQAFVSDAIVPPPEPAIVRAPRRRSKMRRGALESNLGIFGASLGSKKRMTKHNVSR